MSDQDLNIRACTLEPVSVKSSVVKEVVMPISKICSVCSEPFKVPPSQDRVTRCSMKCYQKTRIKHDMVEFNGDKYYLHPSKGYFIRGSDKGYLHRVVWQYYNGEIPEGFVVHHKDHNKINNDIDNLELVERGLHTAQHNTRKVERKCDVEDCSARHRARGLCNSHYYYWYKENKACVETLEGVESGV